ncbi:cytochrome P450 [Streptomyces diastatochromogenes]|nr:cytochrome P450 [Streptomyces diastatochromogenes]
MRSSPAVPLAVLDRLSLDVAAPHAADSALHLGGLIVFEGEPPSRARALDHLRHRIGLLPELAHRLAGGPGCPRREPDPGFDPDLHPYGRPGGADLLTAAAELLRQPLPRDRPLWGIRLYPPAWAITRTATRATELAGRTLPPGSVVICCLYLLHRRRELFPTRRASTPAGGRRGRAEGRLAAVRARRHQCVGEMFGTAEATLALAAIASRWRLTPVSPRPPRPVPRIVLSPGPQPMRLAQR